MPVQILRHANCFDGFASAATFVRFYRDRISADASFVHKGLRHGRPEPLDPTLFGHDVNVIVDFRYSPDGRLQWWFDHHLSAFITDTERRQFERRHAPQHFWNPKAPSCAGFMAHQLAESYDWDPAPLAEVSRWADIIDAARFESAEAAVALREPALQLMVVCEHTQDGKLAQKIIEGLATGDLETLAQDTEVRRLFGPIKRRQTEALELVENAIERRGEVAFVDLTPWPNVINNKFAAYALAPESLYVVVVLAQSDRVRLSVGVNPWREADRRHDISSICERFGGGGHPVVGGITIPRGTREQARHIGRRIVELLEGPPIPDRPTD